MEKTNRKLRPESPRKVAYYIRCSTEEQNESPDGTIRNQEERLSATLKLKNQIAGGESGYGKYVGTYTDVKSGKDMNRPELRRLLRDIESGEVDVVMVTELSRLSRSIKDFSEIWEYMQAKGCRFLSLRENFDTSTASGEMMLYSLANFSQYERRQTSERVAANMDARARRGLWNGGVLPVGYEPDPDHRGNLRIVETEAATVRAAFHALIHEGSVSAAAKWLNRNGFSYGSVLRGGGFCPPIIDLATFEEAKTVLLAGKKQKTGRESRYPYLLSARIYCEECGSALVGRSAYGNSGKVGYYEHGCQVKREQALDVKSPRCQPFRVPAKKLEERVWKEVVDLLEGVHREKFFESVRALEKNQSTSHSPEKKIGEKTATEAKIKNLARRIGELPEGIPADVLYSEMRTLAGANTRLETEIRDLERKDTAQEIATESQLERLFEKIRTSLPTEDTIDAETKRKVIQALIHKVVITNVGFKMHFYVASDPIKKGEQRCSPLKSWDKKISVPSSFKSLNGGPTKNRTWN